jgi:4-amino-4-deoxy-L-arabinose transferase-like glycosyltransferase
LHLKSLFKPRLGAPLPAWMIFPAVFAAIYASHFTLLRLPYYWDEAGYYIPAAWDFFRTGSLIPFSTLTNAHPPVPSIYLALCWKAAGFLPVVTRTSVVFVAAFGLTAVWRLAMRLVGVPSVAFWTVALTALYPVWFAQSTLAHADIFAAACTLWGLVYVLPTMNHDLPRKPWLAAIWFSLAALSKETAIVVPLTLAVVSLVESRRAPGRARTRLWSESAWLTGCLLPLAAWYAFHYFKTGFLFGNPEFLRYNAQANLSPFRILSAFGYRILHLTAHMNLFLPVGIAIAALLLDPLPDTLSVPHPDSAQLPGAPSLRLVSGARVGSQNSPLRPAIDSPALRRIAFLLLANALFFSVLGGALLTRYLLPMYPLVLLVVVTTFYRRVPYWRALAVFSAAVFILGLFLNPPYRFAPEDNLAYARVIRLHQAGIAELEKLYPGSTVLTAWPLSDELLRPELGYLTQPFAVYRLEDFTADQIARAAQEPEKFSAALVFSTKYDPPSLPLSLGPRAEAVDERYFGLHHDLPPELIALQLHGDLVWKQQDHGQWIALIRFSRQYDARLERKLDLIAMK